MCPQMTAGKAVRRKTIVAAKIMTERVVEEDAAWETLEKQRPVKERMP
jgi:hypothetical protein